MSKIKQAKHVSELKLEAIELLSNSLHLPASDITLNSFHFNIEIDNKTDKNSKRLFTIVSVEILSEDKNHILGAIALSCIYSISNFDELLKEDLTQIINMPKKLVEKINTISLSTTRGVMFSIFKGTFLHNALLPIINPQTTPA